MSTTPDKNIVRSCTRLSEIDGDVRTFSSEVIRVQGGAQAAMSVLNQFAEELNQLITGLPERGELDEQVARQLISRLPEGMVDMDMSCALTSTRLVLISRDAVDFYQRCVRHLNETADDRFDFALAE